MVEYENRSFSKMERRLSSANGKSLATSGFVDTPMKNKVKLQQTRLLFAFDKKFGTLETIQSRTNAASLGFLRAFSNSWNIRVQLSQYHEEKDGFARKFRRNHISLIQQGYLSNDRG